MSANMEGKGDMGGMKDKESMRGVKLFRRYLALILWCVPMLATANDQQNTPEPHNAPVRVLIATDGQSPQHELEPDFTLIIPELIEGIRKHHPILLSAQAKREQAELAALRARGEFDLRIDHESLFRTSGFYHGKYASQSITKPLEFAKAELSAGYRISDGDFPIYENYFNTQTAGEASIGLKMSLLRNRDIDKRRTGLQDAEFLRAIGISEEQIKLNNLLYKGISAYLDWFEARQQTTVVDELVSLANLRRTGIESRVANGDLAALSLTEFETTLLSRRIALQEAKQAGRLAQQMLSFYWRDEQGKPHAFAHEKPLPKDIHWPFSAKDYAVQTLRQGLQRHPELQEINANINIARNKLRLAENDYLPELDLEVKVARDLGQGSTSLAGTESFVGVSFSMPLERSRATADKSAANAKIRELNYKKQAMMETMQLNLQAQLQMLANLRQLLTLRQAQADVANTLQRQENARFQAGDSDQFLLNARETTAGRARLAAIKASVDVLRQELELMAMSGRLGANEPEAGLLSNQ